MKRALLAALLSVAVSTTQAAILDFNTGVPAGITLGSSSGQVPGSVGMEWNNTGGGHLFMRGYAAYYFVDFMSPTTVNSFQMNRAPWEGYNAYNGVPNWQVTIETFDNNSNSLWQGILDLSTYDAWNEWLTVDVNKNNVSRLWFQTTTDWNSVYGFWPSIDNMQINEQQQVPEPASLALLGLGLAGLATLRRRKAA